MAKWGNALGGWRKQKRAKKGQFGSKPGGSAKKKVTSKKSSTTTSRAKSAPKTVANKKTTPAQTAARKRAARAKKYQKRQQNVAKASLAIGAGFLAYSAIRSHSLKKSQPSTGDMLYNISQRGKPGANGAAQRRTAAARRGEMPAMSDFSKQRMEKLISEVHSARAAEKARKGPDRINGAIPMGPVSRSGPARPIRDPLARDRKVHRNIQRQKQRLRKQVRSEKARVRSEIQRELGVGQPLGSHWRNNSDYRAENYRMTPKTKGQNKRARSRGHY